MPSEPISHLKMAKKLLKKAKSNQPMTKRILNEFDVMWVGYCPTPLSHPSTLQFKKRVKKWLTKAIQAKDDDIKSVLSMVEGDTPRKKIASYIKEYLL